MKRKIFLALAVALLPALTAAAQDRPKPYFGARVVMDITEPGHGDKYFDTGSGFSVGGIVNIPVYRGFYFEPGVAFTLNTMGIKGMLREDGYLYDGSARTMGIRVPLNFGYAFQLLDNLSLGVYTGPWLNFNVSAREHVTPNFSTPDPVPEFKNNLFSKGWKHFDAQWGFGLSVTFAQHYHLGLSGGVSITPLAQYGNKDKKIRIHRNIIAISLGYNF